MKKLFMLFMLAVSMKTRTIAQTAPWMQLRTATDIQYNMPEYRVVTRDIVTLKEGKIIIEMNNVKDYAAIRNLDSLLLSLHQSMDFYRDSLQADETAAYRVDYAFLSDMGVRNLRFKKYPADGSSFIDNHGEISKLKLEKDTVRIFIEQQVTRENKHAYYRPVQVTFLLKNVADIEKIAARKDDLRHIIDTLAQYRSKREHIKHPYANKSTVFYRSPFFPGSNSHIVEFNRLLNSELESFSAGKNIDLWAVRVNAGAGLVRNTIAPMAEAGIMRRWHVGMEPDYYDFAYLFATPYFLFSKDANNNYAVNTNWFANIAFGSNYTEEFMGLKTKHTAIGAGYLFASRGDIFKGTTLKAFMSFQLPMGVTLVPEIIVTNNFKQVFPGVTVKVF